jgi:hypothetical protein
MLNIGGFTLTYLKLFNSHNIQLSQMKKSLSNGFYLVCALCVCTTQFSCQHSAKFTPEDTKLVTDSARNMMSHIAQDISAKGPIAWIDYFENSPGFFMASGGELALKDYPSAASFVKNTLVKAMPEIRLDWRHISVDPIDQNFAAIGADFHEDITMSNGTAMPFDGYFTALAHFDGLKWRLRNLHWSIKQAAAH